MLEWPFLEKLVLCNPKSESAVFNTSTQNHQVNNHPACTAVSPQGQREQRSCGAFRFEILEASEVGVLKKIGATKKNTFFGRHKCCNIEEFCIVSFKLSLLLLLLLLLLLSSKYMLCFFWIIPVYAELLQPH